MSDANKSDYKFLLIFFFGFFVCLFVCLFVLGFFFFFLFGFLFFFFRERVYLCSHSCPGTHSVDQAGRKLRDLPVSASQVLGLKVCTTMPCACSYP